MDVRVLGNRHPVQGGPGEHDVVGGGGGQEAGDVLGPSLDEGLVRTGVSVRLDQHRGRRVEADHVTVGHGGGDPVGEVT